MDRVACILTFTHSNIVVLCLCTASASTAMALISMLRATYLKEDRVTGRVTPSMEQIGKPINISFIKCEIT